MKSQKKQVFKKTTAISTGKRRKNGKNVNKFKETKKEKK